MRKDGQIMRRNLRFVLLTAALILVTGLSVGGTAMCMPKSSVTVKEQYYEQMEEEYIEEVRAILENAGLTHAGIMLTHVREEDGTRTYTLFVHHRNYFYLNLEERDSLSGAVADCAFDADRCVFIQNYDG